MHEAKLCLSLLRMAEEALAAAGATRITRLRIQIGELSGVAPDALQAAFPICAAAGPARGAELCIAPVPGREIVLRDMEVT